VGASATSWVKICTMQRDGLCRLRILKCGCTAHRHCALDQTVLKDLGCSEHRVVQRGPCDSGNCCWAAVQLHMDCKLRELYEFVMAAGGMVWCDKAVWLCG
jgi:hypothetical protein